MGGGSASEQKGDRMGGGLDIVLLTYYQNHNQFIAFQQWPKIQKVLIK